MDFKSSLSKYLTKEEIDRLISSFSEDEKKAIYINENKLSKVKLLELFPNLKPHPIVPNGFLYNKNEYELPVPQLQV